MVAGACNHPNLLVLPFRLELIPLAAQPVRKAEDWRSPPGNNWPSTASGNLWNQCAKSNSCLFPTVGERQPWSTGTPDQPAACRRFCRAGTTDSAHLPARPSVWSYFSAAPSVQEVP